MSPYGEEKLEEKHTSVPVKCLNSQLIDMDKSLSVQIYCFKTIIWFVPFMFP